MVGIKHSSNWPNLPGTGFSGRVKEESRPSSRRRTYVIGCDDHLDEDFKVTPIDAVLLNQVAPPDGGASGDSGPPTPDSILEEICESRRNQVSGESEDNPVNIPRVSRNVDLDFAGEVVEEADFEWADKDENVLGSYDTRALR